MKLTVFNGSPRGTGSNTRVLLDHFIAGFEETPGNSTEIFYLNHVKRQDEFVRAFRAADNIVLAIPLYTDAMPGVVKTFIESLAGLSGSPGKKSIGFIVQSGFGEPVHSRYVQRYFRKLAARLGCRYIDTIVRGGAEGIKVQPPFMTKKLFRSFRELGASYGKTGRFDENIIRSLARRERYSPAMKLLFSVMSILGLTDYYSNGQLKKNGAYDRRFDRPYMEETK